MTMTDRAITASELASAVSRVANALAYLRGIGPADPVDLERVFACASAFTDLAALAERGLYFGEAGGKPRPLQPEPLRDLATSLRLAAEREQPLPWHEVDAMWQMLGGRDVPL
jgi:hypothetical protein